MKTCAEIERHFIPYIQRELSPEKAQSVRAHLADCAACGDKFTRVQTAFAAMPDLPSRPAEAPELLAARAREHWHARRKITPFGYCWRTAFAACVLLLACCLTRLLLPGGKHVPVATLPAQPAAPVPAPKQPRTVLPPLMASKAHQKFAPARRLARVPARRHFAAAIAPQTHAPAPRTYTAALTLPARHPLSTANEDATNTAFRQYAQAVVDAMQADEGGPRHCSVLPIQVDESESTPCADVATVALTHELAQLAPDFRIHRLPPLPLTTQIARGRDLPPDVQQLAKDVDGYLIIGRLTPHAANFDLALSVIDARTGSVVLDSSHPVRLASI